jgi:molybdate transport system permease protein
MLTAEEWEVLELSLRVALCCVVVSLPLGVGLGWLLARAAFRGKVLLDLTVSAISRWSSPRS